MPVARQVAFRAAPPQVGAAGTGWVGTWATAVAVPEAGTALTGFTDVTIRQRLRVTVGGDTVRLRLTNTYGTRPLEVRAVTLARPADATGPAGRVPGEVDPASLTRVTFAGSTEVRVPPGAVLLSDQVPFALPDRADLLVSLYLPGPTGPATYHESAHATGWLASGDHTTDPGATAFDRRTTSFWYVDAVDVRADVAGAVVCLGDSITDGTGISDDSDLRWPDQVAARMLAHGPVTDRFTLLNTGIGGNRLLRDANNPGQGANVLARLDRDVLTRTGVRTVVLLEGINDIQQDPSEYDPDQLIMAYRQVLSRCHALGIRLVLGTLLPFQGWDRWTPEREAVRAAVNAWIRTTGEVDGVIDFDAAVRDPAAPLRMLPAYDMGDGLHPGEAGYRAMADAVDLDLIRPTPAGKTTGSLVPTAVV